MHPFTNTLRTQRNALRRRRRALLLSATLALLATLALPARADQPVHNGQISFGRFDPALGGTSLWVTDGNGSHERRLTDDLTGFSDWSPDGRTIAFDYQDNVGDIHIAVIRPDGRGRRSLTTAPGIQEVPSWSPDGTQIAFDAFDPTQPVFSTSIWVMNSDGTAEHQVTTDGFDVEPAFAPDGQHIAFARITDDTNGVETILVVDTDGTGLRQVVPPTTGLEHPDWSPDGRWIIYNLAPEADVPGAGSIFAVHPDGTDLHEVRAAGAHLLFFKPRWSPDGRRFVSGCLDRRVGHDQLCTFTFNGHGRVHLLRLTGSEPVNFPAWGARPGHGH